MQQSDFENTINKRERNGEGRRNTIIKAPPTATDTAIMAAVVTIISH